MRTKLISFMLFSLFVTGSVAADLFLVTTTEGPGFSDPEEVAAVLENGIIPTFEALMELESQKKIIAGGLPLGSRKLYFVVDAKSHDEVDRMLRGLPAWGVFSWKVTALQSFAGRAKMEEQNLEKIKSGD